MHRIIVRLSVAVVTFALGVAITALLWMSRAPMLSPSDVPRVAEQGIDVTITIPPVVTSCYPGRSIDTATIDKSAYFPPKVLSDYEWSANWYSTHLRAMDEAPLYATDDRSLESYRFLWLRSFHHPVAVCIWTCGTVRFVSVKEMSGGGGFGPKTLILNKTRELTNAEWNEFIQHLDDSCFWQLPTTTDQGRGEDGAQWVFEAVKQGRYHIVDRWSPQGGSYRELCLYALKISGLKVDTASQPLY